ncbi:MAG: hypothetical protein IJV41_08170 [Oscillospiraceae bacterium]|nr:hypothetical protein [Oscillospiraceae bacterium]
MKKFLIKTLAFALIFALTAAGLCVGIDPYNVFHPLSYRENGVEPNKNYIKMVYVLHEPEKFDTFLFGSSRVGFVNAQKLSGARAYNMTGSMALPREHLDNLKTMLHHGIVPKNIIIEIDDLSYRNDPDDNLRQHQRAPYEYLRRHPLRFAELYLCPVVALDALEIIRYSSRNAQQEADFYASGSTIVYGERGQYSPHTREDLSGPSYLDGAMAAMEEIARLCRENGVRLTVFVTPMHYATYTGALERGDYFSFLRRLAQITPFYNFSGYNDITLDSDNYMDTSHYLAEVGDRIIDVIWNGNADERLLAQGFGFYTDTGNVEQLIQTLEQGNALYYDAFINEPIS